MRSKRFLFFVGMTLLLAALIGAIVRLLEVYSFIEEAPTYWAEILLFFFVTTVLLYFVLHKITLIDPTEFVRTFLMSVVLKIILSGVAIVILLKLNLAGGNSNAVFYLSCYGAFTALEVVVLYIQKNKE
ncbi:MAG: hypothetical protein ORN54_08405 [Cyclobacteriaceae bacterium]|nr:hypothetical protein [Cyclobacteriaceae bacterium]